MTTLTTMECSVSIGNEVQDYMQEFLKSRMPAGSSALDCDFKEGMLLIRGDVGSYYAKQLAQEYARQIPGVEQVANHLTVVRADQIA
jgi:osmotically-inducible protein OsmY